MHHAVRSFVALLPILTLGCWELQDNSPDSVRVRLETTNRAPVAQDVVVALDEDTMVEFQLAATDPDGDSLAFIVVTAPTNGEVFMDDPALGRLRYRPAPNYFGQDRLSYLANDGQRDSNTATVHLAINAINDAPDSHTHFFKTNEDVELTDTLNGIDVDGDALSFDIVVLPEFGVIELIDATGSAFRYQPQENYFGIDAFSFRVSDGQATSAVYKAYIEIASINDAPTIAPATFQTSMYDALNSSLAAYDVDGDALTFAVTVQPAHGEVMIIDDNTGAFSYVPDGQFWGEDSFRVQVSDGLAASPIVKITVVIAPLPKIASTSLSAGPTGIPLAIRGTRFFDIQGPSFVRLGQRSLDEAIRWSDRELTITVPTDLEAGTYSLSVSTIEGESPATFYTVLPWIHKLTKTDAWPGEVLTIRGSAFGAVQGQVAIGTKLATVSSWSNTEVVVITPGGHKGLQPLIVQTFSGQISNRMNLTVKGSDVWILPQAPMAATGQSAVWSGVEMIVWGGFDGSRYLNVGSRYNPIHDSWTTISQEGAPSPRQFHNAVWTGTRMLVWGGDNGATQFSDGAMYDPFHDRWEPMAGGAPSARTMAQAVWTGQKMVVWGGFGVKVNSGTIGHLGDGGWFKYRRGGSCTLPAESS